MSDSWYVRRGKQVRGPFVPGLLAELIAAGRLREQDELSSDRRCWSSLGRLRAVLLAPGEPAPAERESLRPRPKPRACRLGEPARETRALGPGSVLASIVLAVFVIGVGFMPRPPESAVDCAAHADVGVDWSGCTLAGVGLQGAKLSGARARGARLDSARLSAADLTSAELTYAELAGADLSYSRLRRARLVGADLRGADLTYADLRDANLSYADLHGALLGGAELAGAVLDKAIWLDGRVCAPGSRGSCRRPPLSASAAEF